MAAGGPAAGGRRQASSLGRPGKLTGRRRGGRTVTVAVFGLESESMRCESHFKSSLGN